MPELPNGFPCTSNDSWSPFTHHRALWQVLAPQCKRPQWHTCVCATVEFRECLGSIKQIDDVLSILFSCCRHIRVVKTTACPAWHECSHDWLIYISKGRWRLEFHIYRIGVCRIKIITINASNAVAVTDCCVEQWLLDQSSSLCGDQMTKFLQSYNERCADESSPVGVPTAV